MLKPYHNSPLLYEKGLSVIINEMAIPVENSTCYYFDYDQRSQSINMEFPHFHSFYEIMIPLCPKAYHFISGKRYDIRANDIVLLAPSILHQSEYLPGPPSDRIIIGFMFPKHLFSYPQGYQEILSVFHAPIPIFRFNHEEQTLLFQRLNEVIELSQKISNPHLRDLMIHNKFTEFLFVLWNLRNQNQYIPNAENGIRGKIYTITNYIHTHYSENISLASISDTFYISPYYLSHQFKDVTGYTVVQYIQLTRIKNAQYFLLNSDMKITAVAERTGFSSFSQFNRVFRKFSGMSPSDYKLSSHAGMYGLPGTEEIQ